MKLKRHRCGKRRVRNGQRPSAANGGKGFEGPTNISMPSKFTTTLLSSKLRASVSVTSMNGQLLSLNVSMKPTGRQRVISGR